MSNGARCESGAEPVLVRAVHACDYSVREGALDASGFEAVSAPVEVASCGEPAGSSRIAVLAEDSIFAGEAELIARRLGAKATLSFEEASRHPVHLLLGANGLSLVSGGLSMRGDFTHLTPRLRRDRLGRELLVKASKVKGLAASRDAASRDLASPRPLAVDATAGLGEDSLLLAAAGFDVLMFERNPVIAALLDDALRRAAGSPELADVVARMRLCRQDSIEALSAMEGDVAVVLLDPMFPARTKSAAVKKKFQLLHLIEQPCSDEEELLDAAVGAKPLKVVVKRPPKGPYLAGVKPSYSVEGKAVRYDVIVPPR